ncbi:hypothetical protein ONZ51_g10537 [Trametes cubensis]|uniref:DNA 3'-5' helicase n=1 Tax=Trametes cubensis TaxID=1111947 RepID=A0AAD7TJU3_9APHY|nr:hypothetical protein ONZ51_g10537 [Trametes cubensis]
MASSVSATSRARPPFVFSTAEGRILVRRVLQKKLPYTPHDYQLEGVCKLLDGTDLVAVLPTGAGKTGFYMMYMLLLLELSQKPTLCDPPYIPLTKDPCLIMVYPTNGLEEEQAKTFESAGIRSLVINRETLATARGKKTSLWVIARTDISILLLSPEQLASPGFESLLRHPAFYSRICGLGLDELHLLDSWGLGFRQSYRQMGYVRARLPAWARFLGGTATMLVGDPQDRVFNMLGLRQGNFYLLRHSNIRWNAFYGLMIGYWYLLHTLYDTNMVNSVIVATVLRD